MGRYLHYSHCTEKKDVVQSLPLNVSHDCLLLEGSCSYANTVCSLQKTL